jgi:hypothetical protein
MSVTATFTRNSTAYKEDGTPVRAGVPRFEDGVFGQGIMVEEGTTNIGSPASLFDSSWVLANGASTVIDAYTRKYTFISTPVGEFVFKTFTLTTGVAYTWSAEIKGEGSTVGKQVRLQSAAESAYGTPVTLTTEWQRVTLTFTATAISRAAGFIGVPTNTFVSGDVVYVRFFQLEAKPYATSFTDGTRAAETLTIPTAGVLSPQEGTISVWAYINDIARRQVPGQYNRIWQVQGANPNANINIQHRPDEANWRLQIYDDNRNPYAVLVDDSLLPDGWHMLVARWKNGEYADIFIDGVLRGHIDNPIMPSAFAEFRLGYNSTYCNTVYDDLRIDNIARSDAEILAAYQSGQPLQRDQYTTCLLTFDGTLRYKTRQFEVLSNTPSTGYISWSDLNIGYKGIFYNVADGSTNKKFAWWDYTQPYVLQTGDEVPVLTNDDVLVFFNKNGAAVTVPMATVVDGSLIVPESIVADAIAANTITGEKIAANTISADNIAANAVTADKVAANAIGAAAIAAGAVATEKLAANAVTSEKIHAGAVTAEKIGAKAVTAEKINVESLSAISSNIGHITAGQIDAGVVRIGPQTTFAPGYDPSQIEGAAVGMGVEADCLGLWHFDGSLNSHKGVAAVGDANFETGIFGQAVKVEEGTTNYLNGASDIASPFVGGTLVTKPEVVSPCGDVVIEWTAGRNDDYTSFKGAVSCSAGEKVTVSIWARKISSSANCEFYFSHDGTYSNFNFSPTLEWQRYSFTVTCTGTTTVSTRLDNNIQGDIVQFSGWQLEKKPYPTPFVDGTRLGVLKFPTTGLSASQGTISFRAKNLAESGNGSVLIDLPDSTNTEGLRVGISGDDKIYVEKIMNWVEEPDDFSQTETDFSTGTLNQVWQAEGGLQIATTTRTWNDFTGESWNDLA